MQMESVWLIDSCLSFPWISLPLVTLYGLKLTNNKQKCIENCESGKKERAKEENSGSKQNDFCEFGWRLIYFLISLFIIRVNTQKTFNPTRFIFCFSLNHSVS